MILIDFLVRERLENLGKLQGELFLIVFVILFLGKLRCVFVVCSLCVRCVFDSALNWYIDKLLLPLHSK